EQQFFTDKKPNASFDPGRPGAADHNNPFVRHDVGTMNLFDAEDPLAIAQMDQIFQNPRIPIPASRGPLGDYLTPVLNDVWNTAPYLHDGSAHTLLDVVRPCDTTVDDCLEAGRGRNLNGQHGVTSILTPQQLNDLVAFQKTLTLATIVGTNERVISAGALDRSSEGRPRLLARHAAGRADGDRRAQARDEGRRPAPGGALQRGRWGGHHRARAHTEGLSLHRQGAAPGSRGALAGRRRPQEPRPDRRLRGERRELRAQPESG